MHSRGVYGRERQNKTREPGNMKGVGVKGVLTFFAQVQNQQRSSTRDVSQLQLRAQHFEVPLSADPSHLAHDPPLFRAPFPTTPPILSTTPHDKTKQRLPSSLRACCMITACRSLSLSLSQYIYIYIYIYI